jgi:hypothetical protein
MPSTASLCHPLLHSPVQPPHLHPMRYSLSTTLPCRWSHAPCRHGRLLQPPPCKRRAKSAHARGPLHEATAILSSCYHARASLGKCSHRSTVVPRRHAVGAATPSSELSGLSRARRWAVVPQGRGPRREASPASLWAARAMHAGRAGAVPLAASGFGPLAFVLFF